MIMTENRLSKNSIGYWIRSALVLVIMVGFRCLPAIEPITELGMQVVGIFFGMLFGWLFVDIIWPSILGLIMLGLTEYCTVAEALKSGFGNNTALLVFFFCIVAGIMAEAGVTSYVARKIVASKIARGRPYMLMLMICFAMCVVTSLVSITAACLVMFPMIQEIAAMYGYKKGDRWPTLMMIGSAFVGEVAYNILPFKSVPAVVLATYTSYTGKSIPYGRYLLMILSATAASIVLFLLYAKFVERIDVSLIAQTKNRAIEAGEPMNKYQKVILFYFVVVIALLLFPSILPDGIPIISLLNRIGSTGIVALSVAAYGLIHFQQGQELQKLFSDSINWSVFFLLASCLTMAGALVSDEVGVMDWIVEVVTPMVSGKSAFVIAFFIIILSTVFTNFANNLSMAAVFSSVGYTLGAAVGTVNIEVLMVCIIMTTGVGLATPPAGAASALYFGDPWTNQKMAYKTGILLCIVNVLIAIVFGYLLGSMLF